jgi:hypothetical protein
MTNIDADPYVLVEGPPFGDAEFYGKWLLAAAEAEALWRALFKDDPIFTEQVDILWLAEIPEFGMAASAMLMNLWQYRTTFVLRLYEALGEMFAMMAAMDFFSQAGQRYQMTLPVDLSRTKVKTAMLRYAQTSHD